MFILATLTIITPILATIWIYSIYFRFKKHLKHFDYIKLKVNDTKEAYDLMMSQAKNELRNVWTMLGPYPILLTADPNIFNTILLSSKHTTKPILYKTIENSMKGTIFCVNGKIWRNQRRFLMSRFDQNAILRFMGIFNKQGDELVDNFEGEIINVDEIVDSCTLKFVYESFLGEKINNLEKIKECYNILARLCAERAIKIVEFFDLTYFFTKNYRIERNAINYLFWDIKNVINKRKSKKNKLILIDVLLDEMEINETLDEEGVIRQLMLMIIAGFDTTTHSISLLFYNLSKYPKIQQKAREEIVLMIGDDPKRFVSIEDLKQLRYLDLIIKESLRIHTTAPTYSRYLLEDVKINEEMILPKGLTITFLPGVMHRNSNLYPNPEEFIPERFENEEIKNDEVKYAPFCVGMRQCIGKKYATLAIKVVLIKVLLKYELVDVKHELSLAMELTLAPINGVKIGVRRRVRG